MKRSLFVLIVIALLCAALVGLPLLALLVTAGAGALGGALTTLQHLAGTVLPGYLLTTLLLCALVAIGTTALGFCSAFAVTAFEFRSRRVAQWALVLPLAAPAYVLAYAYTDFFQPSGSLFGFWQGLLGQGNVPRLDIRNVWGAAFVLSGALYPYVYLLVRAALLNVGGNVWEAAQSLGTTLPQRVWRVLVPITRPAIVAGVSLALMETLADYGVVSYFGIHTLTTGIYRAWLSLFDWAAAAQLAIALLCLVTLLIALERIARSRQRYARGPNDRPFTPVQLRGRAEVAAIVVAWLPVLLGFIVPVLVLLKLLLDAGAPDMVRFGQWAFNTVKLATLAACVAFAFAALLAATVRLHQSRAVRWAAHGVSLGYAVPGAVIAVGILMPAMALQQWGLQNAGVWITGSAVGLIFAYVVRFSAVALQPLDAGYAQLSLRLDESARSLGAGRTRLIFGVHAPLLKTSLITAWLIVLIDVMKELPATWLLRPFGYDTLAVVAHQLAKDERLGEAALPSLAIVLLGLLPVILLLRSLKLDATQRQ
jgi:iron(III) transport system permease protein